MYDWKIQRGFQISTSVSSRSVTWVPQKVKKQVIPPITVREVCPWPSHLQTCWWEYESELTYQQVCAGFPIRHKGWCGSWSTSSGVTHRTPRSSLERSRCFSSHQGLPWPCIVGCLRRRNTMHSILLQGTTIGTNSHQQQHSSSHSSCRTCHSSHSSCVLLKKLSSQSFPSLHFQTTTCHTNSNLPYQVLGVIVYALPLILKKSSYPASNLCSWFQCAFMRKGELDITKNPPVNCLSSNHLTVDLRIGNRTWTLTTKVLHFTAWGGGAKTEVAGDVVSMWGLESSSMLVYNQPEQTKMPCHFHCSPCPKLQAT